MKIAKRVVLCAVICTFILLLCSCGGSGQKRTVVIVIDYPKIDVSALYDDDVIVYVDKIEIGEVKFGDMGFFEVELTDGSHKIYVKNDALIRKYKSKKVKLSVSEKTDYFELEVKAGNWKGLKKTKTSSIATESKRAIDERY